MDYQMIINEMLERVAPLVGVGEQATYIPALANVEPDQMGVCIETVQGEVFTGGRAETRFSIQSISKVFTLAMAFALEGEELWRRMGRELQFGRRRQRRQQVLQLRRSPSRRILGF